jgi:protein-S-isoprenylcysteine O-methyltransferase Ste14
VPWPLESFLYFSGCNLLKGALAARAVYHLSDEIEIEQGASLLVIGLLLLLAVVQGMCDYRLLKLRVPGERGYKIPVGFPFTYVSNPSYLLEIVIWILWGLTMPLDFGTIAIWLWLLPNVYARAEATHRWYQRTFKGQYPKRRTAILPFVNVPKVFTGVLTTMQYMD